MKYSVQTVEEYLDALPEHRVDAFLRLRQVIKESLPHGFEECFSYGMPSFVVPLSLYPQGYHCKVGEPLPFISVGNQKHFIGLYHMGLYAFAEIDHWFEQEYLALGIGKLDRGKSCIRLKRMDKIPYDLIGELCGKITVEQWIEVYEQSRLR